MTATAPAEAADRHLIVVSNRGPVSWSRGDDGGWTPRKGAGGLIVALGDALQSRPGTWVSVALDEGDRAVAAEHADGPFDVDTGRGHFTLRLVDVGDAYDAYYNHVANRLLWFTLHQLWSSPYTPAGRGWSGMWRDYLDVNAQLADAVVAEARRADGPVDVHVQDYHLLTMAPLLREALPEARILHYLHTPWVHPTYFRRLPDPMVAQIMEGLAACDLVAASAVEWRHGLRDCMVELHGAQLLGDEDHRSVVRTPAGQEVVIADVILGIDSAGLHTVAETEQTQQERRALRASTGDRALIVRADRTDLSKNILRGFDAFDLLLERHPDLAGSVHFLALLNPSRQSVPEYRTYVEACTARAEEIRDRWGPDVLTLDTGTNFPKVVAAYQDYDVLLVNPVIDGTNLVAKEGPTLNERDGVLVLSRHAGAAEVMDDALRVNPFDVEQTADALREALVMADDERRRRAAGLRDAAAIGSPGDWLDALEGLLP